MAHVLSSKHLYAFPSKITYEPYPLTVEHLLDGYGMTVVVGFVDVHTDLVVMGTFVVYVEVNVLVSVVGTTVVFV